MGILAWRLTSLTGMTASTCTRSNKNLGQKSNLFLRQLTRSCMCTTLRRTSHVQFPTHQTHGNRLFKISDPTPETNGLNEIKPVFPVLATMVRLALQEVAEVLFSRTLQPFSGTNVDRVRIILPGVGHLQIRPSKTDRTAILPSSPMPRLW